MADDVGPIGTGETPGAREAATNLSASFDKAIATQQQLQQITLEKAPLLDAAKEKIK
jgi:hypothetical protein